MEVVSLFADTLSISEPDRQRFVRAARAGGSLLRIARGGAVRLNPAAVWVEAALSVADAVQAWARYEQARAITRQLEAECETLRHLYTATLRRLDLERQARDTQTQTRLAQLDQRLREDHRTQRELVTRIRQGRGTIMKLRDITARLHATASYDPGALQNLDAAIESLVRAQMNVILHALDANE